MLFISKMVSLIAIFCMRVNLNEDLSSKRLFINARMLATREELKYMMKEKDLAETEGSQNVDHKIGNTHSGVTFGQAVGNGSGVTVVVKEKDQDVAMGESSGDAVVNPLTNPMPLASLEASAPSTVESLSLEDDKEVVEEQQVEQENIFDVTPSYSLHVTITGEQLKEIYAELTDVGKPFKDEWVLVDQPKISSDFSDSEETERGAGDTGAVSGVAMEVETTEDSKKPMFPSISNWTNFESENHDSSNRAVQFISKTAVHLPNSLLEELKGQTENLGFPNFKSVGQTLPKDSPLKEAYDNPSVCEQCMNVYEENAHGSFVFPMYTKLSAYFYGGDPAIASDVSFIDENTKKYLATNKRYSNSKLWIDPIRDWAKCSTTGKFVLTITVPGSIQTLLNSPSPSEVQTALQWLSTSLFGSVSSTNISIPLEDTRFLTLPNKTPIEVVTREEVLDIVDESMIETIDHWFVSGNALSLKRQFPDYKFIGEGARDFVEESRDEDVDRFEEASSRTSLPFDKTKFNFHVGKSYAAVRFFGNFRTRYAEWGEMKEDFLDGYYSLLLNVLEKNAKGITGTEDLDAADSTSPQHVISDLSSRLKSYSIAYLALRQLYQSTDRDPLKIILRSEEKCKEEKIMLEKRRKVVLEHPQFIPALMNFVKATRDLMYFVNSTESHSSGDAFNEIKTLCFSSVRLLVKWLLRLSIANRPESEESGGAAAAVVAFAKSVFASKSASVEVVMNTESIKIVLESSEFVELMIMILTKPYSHTEGFSVTPIPGEKAVDDKIGYEAVDDKIGYEHSAGDVNFLDCFKLALQSETFQQTFLIREATSSANAVNIFHVLSGLIVLHRNNIDLNSSIFPSRIVDNGKDQSESAAFLDGVLHSDLFAPFHSHVELLLCGGSVASQLTAFFDIDEISDASKFEFAVQLFHIERLLRREKFNSDNGKKSHGAERVANGEMFFKQPKFVNAEVVKFVIRYLIQSSLQWERQVDGGTKASTEKSTKSYDIVQPRRIVSQLMRAGFFETLISVFSHELYHSFDARGLVWDLMGVGPDDEKGLSELLKKAVFEEGNELTLAEDLTMFSKEYKSDVPVLLAGDTLKFVKGDSCAWECSNTGIVDLHSKVDFDDLWKAVEQKLSIPRKERRQLCIRTPCVTNVVVMRTRNQSGSSNLPEDFLHSLLISLNSAEKEVLHNFVKELLNPDFQKFHGLSMTYYESHIDLGMGKRLGQTSEHFELIEKYLIPKLGKGSGNFSGSVDTVEGVAATEFFGSKQSRDENLSKSLLDTSNNGFTSIRGVAFRRATFETVANALRNWREVGERFIEGGKLEAGSVGVLAATGVLSESMDICESQSTKKRGLEESAPAAETTSDDGHSLRASTLRNASRKSRKIRASSPEFGIGGAGNPHTVTPLVAQACAENACKKLALAFVPHLKLFFEAPYMTEVSFRNSVAKNFAPGFPSFETSPTVDVDTVDVDPKQYMRFENEWKLLFENDRAIVPEENGAFEAANPHAEKQRRQDVVFYFKQQLEARLKHEKVLSDFDVAFEKYADKLDTDIDYRKSPEDNDAYYFQSTFQSRLKHLFGLEGKDPKKLYLDWREKRDTELTPRQKDSWKWLRDAQHLETDFVGSIPINNTSFREQKVTKKLIRDTAINPSTGESFKLPKLTSVDDNFLDFSRALDANFNRRKIFRSGGQEFYRHLIALNGLQYQDGLRGWGGEYLKYDERWRKLYNVDDEKKEFFIPDFPWHSGKHSLSFGERPLGADFELRKGDDFEITYGK